MAANTTNCILSVVFISTFKILPKTQEKRIYNCSIVIVISSITIFENTCIFRYVGWPFGD